MYTLAFMYGVKHSCCKHSCDWLTSVAICSPPPTTCCNKPALGMARQAFDHSPSSSRRSATMMFSRSTLGDQSAAERPLHPLEPSRSPTRKKGSASYLTMKRPCEPPLSMASQSRSHAVSISHSTNMFRKLPRNNMVFRNSMAHQFIPCWSRIIALGRMKKTEVTYFVVGSIQLKSHVAGVIRLTYAVVPPT